jgi:SAM-dependent methyltransferase
MTAFDPARPPEERIQYALTHGPDVNAQGRFGAVTRFARRIVGRAVKYERDFNLQVDVALLDRVHEIEADAAQQAQDVEERARTADDQLRSETESLRTANDALRERNQRLQLDLANVTDRTNGLDATVAELQARLDDVDARAAVANAVASGAVEQYDSMRASVTEVSDKSRFAYDELTARPDLADARLFTYADAHGRARFGYRGGAGASPVYAGFADIFRGPESMVRDRLRPYIDVVRDRGPVVDLGCGRGEMLELLADAEVEACGVDLDDAMVDRARARGAEVHHGDALDFLIKQDDASLGAIFSAQFIEHLPPSILPELLDVARAKLRPGGVFVAETVNPHSPRALKAFWVDPTHRHPLFPETMLALCRLTGFPTARIMFPGGADDLATDLRTCGEYAVVAGDRLDD